MGVRGLYSVLVSVFGRLLREGGCRTLIWTVFAKTRSRRFDAGQTDSSSFKEREKTAPSGVEG
jgi:hypothetical protein